jgi:hypothetical protein
MDVIWFIESYFHIKLMEYQKEVIRKTQKGGKRK